MRIFHSHGLRAGLPKNAGQETKCRKKIAGESNFGAKCNRLRRLSARVCGQTFNLRRLRKQPNRPTGSADEVEPAFGWPARH
jgi:hypothetical protein